MEDHTVDIFLFEWRIIFEIQGEKHDQTSHVCKGIEVEYKPNLGECNVLAWGLLPNI